MNTINVHEKLKKVKDFLEQEGFTTGYYGGVPHHIGINEQCVTIKPAEHPYDDRVYIIAVSINKVMGYTINTPYNHRDWMRRWEKSYFSQDELRSILQNEMNPRHCW